MGISRNEALECFASDDLIGIGMEADAVRRKLHPEGVVTYTLDGKTTYAETVEPSTSAFARICDSIAETAAMGGTSVTLQSEATPTQTIAWFEALFRRTKEHFPAVWLHCLSASEILTVAEHSGLTVQDTIARLRDAGLDSIPGNDAGILDDAVQPGGARMHWKTQDWLAVHRAAHKLGKPPPPPPGPGGGGEPYEHRVNHLQLVRQLHEET